MQATIKFITEELNSLYPEGEIKGFIRLIMESACGLSLTQMATEQLKEISTDGRARITEIVERLKKYEPIQYILGETEFFGLRFNVNPSVMIPRQETEELVDWVLKTNPGNGIHVCDIGTGSGCIAISLKKNRRDLKVTAFDISEDAIGIAGENAVRNHVEINFLCKDILKPEGLNGTDYEIIVSNPPYVRESEKILMSRNVLDYEPGSAIFVPDSDPLRYYRFISLFASEKLLTGGFLFLEINEALENETVSLLNSRFCNIEVRNDLNGKPRMIKAQKPE